MDEFDAFEEFDVYAEFEDICELELEPMDDYPLSD